MNEFPLVFDLCLTRLDLTIYQKYQIQKQADDIAKSLTKSESKVMTITPEEANDEGRFHFMHIQKGGFATFPSNAEDWDPEDMYYIDGRKACQSGLKVTRVFIVKNMEDLSRPVLIKQIRLDFEAGIDVRLIDYSDYKEIGCEEDFGIWDDEYVCILHRDKVGNLLEGVIDSRMKSILTAQNWRDKIVRGSTKVNSLKDIKEFVLNSEE